MKTIAFTGARRAELIDWADNTAPLAADEVAGRTLVTLVSPGTEANGYIAERQTPGLSGYAAVFEVEAVGAAVTDLHPGDHCFCAGNHVARQRAPRPACVPIPPGLAPEIAVWCRLMGVSWTTLVTTAARPVDRVLVTGLGPVGNLAAQIFQGAGYPVVAVDPAAPRRALANRVGLADARPAIPADAADFALAVECSGHEQAVLDCCRAVKKRGEVALVGVPWRRRTELTAFELLHAVFHRYVVLRSGWEWEVPWQPAEFVTGSIIGNWAGALDWLRQGRVKVDALGRVASPADATPEWQALFAQPGDYLSVVFDWRRLSA